MSDNEEPSDFTAERMKREYGPEYGPLMAKMEDLQRRLRALRERRETNEMHVDVVQRVESGHVLMLFSQEVNELVGQLADDQSSGWRLVGPVQITPSVLGPCYTATLTRGVPGSPLGMEMGGGVGNEPR